MNEHLRQAIDAAADRAAELDWLATLPLDLESELDFVLPDNNPETST